MEAPVNAEDAPVFGISLLIRQRRRRPGENAAGEPALTRADRPSRNANAPVMREAFGDDWRPHVRQDNWSSGAHLHPPISDRETMRQAISGGPQDERYLAGAAPRTRDPYSAAHRIEQPEVTGKSGHEDDDPEPPT
jgi:hypothetical protein